MNNLTKAGLALISIALFIRLALPVALHSFGLHPDYHGEQIKVVGKKALVITTSHGILNRAGETVGDATGVFASELTHPYYTFIDAGMTVDVASIDGGIIPIDPLSFYFPIISPLDKRYLADDMLKAKMNNSIKIEDVDISQYDTIFIAGGWGAAYDLAQSAILADKISEAWRSEKKPILGAVCHGVLGFINARDSDGSLLITGRKITGVTDKQIQELRIEITPLHPEAELRKAGVIFESSHAFRDIFATHVSIDDEQRFVTGQNQNSGLEVAHKITQLLALK
ncbi:MAG: type 1 glutamine amidotransferase domain-containing protein [Paraglaciecola sp.]|nr:type 1 glutamine amidotransferase domain-containing protein [Paraglaciecola sp.]